MVEPLTPPLHSPRLGESPRGQLPDTLVFTVDLKKWAVYHIKRKQVTAGIHCLGSLFSAVAGIGFDPVLVK
jgi:hypothetical protein